ncbi:hypothetical protein WOLCODRAFT_110180 [Wolfiporia cocos MD-104 SS10]|uniref:Transmembrane protein 188 n=1 Tax=Wolfiporia cocos (strain MD-104) TaxID=742152 RepID=A0A2H3J5T0_WOLCO|nr:hypothetical protein WOLCODRAFT_110180 [Wolfiporia cocos MD-104 SS10]
MPPRAPRAGGFSPAYDAATYRDLLLFEERLKTNAASLTRRKRRYQLFLAQLALVIVFLLCEVLLHAQLLAIPYRAVLGRLYALRHGRGAAGGGDEGLPEWARDAEVHPYVASGLLFVAVTTLVLFFASGMYSEKIGYANRYVPHANKALRNFNMYLNVRRPPLGTKLPFNPLTVLFPRPAPVATRAAPARPPSSPPPQSAGPSRSSSPTRRLPAPARKRSGTGSAPLAPMPPASSPRGELIFSSRVERQFRESYERYRTAFERQRDRREREAYEQTWTGWAWTRLGSLAGRGAGGGGAGVRGGN